MIKLSKPSKMPGYSFALPAKECKTGSKLREIEGSVCSKCYARKGFYTWSKAETLRYNNLAQIDNPDFVPVLIGLILNATQKLPFFRWHDSGDLQNLKHFEKIIEIAKALPSVNFWLPTKEKGIITRYRGRIPDNLCIRLSGAMIDGEAPNYANTSTVHKNNAPIGFECKAPLNDGKCGECRACWDKAIKNVSYKQH